MPQSRKWQLTVNNPLEKGLTHEVLKEALAKFTGMLYWCMCDEEGDECETYHTHIYFVLRTATRHTVVDNRFPNIHREIVRGTSADNRAYVLKDGEKYQKQPDGSYDYTDTSGKQHKGKNYSDTFEEWGEMPQEHQGKSKDVERIYSIFADSWRDLTVTYIFGTTGVGKTRSVMDKFGYRNCYRVTDYKHPFDTYDCQDVLILEEYRSQFKIADILNYLDGYPLLLPCRYFNRQACFTKVFLITNVPLEDQYRTVSEESRNAFLRRIHKVVQHGPDGPVEYDSVPAYLARNRWTDQADIAPTMEGF